MSQENVEIVRKGTAAFNRGDLDALFELYDPEVEYHDAGDLPGGGVHHGREALRRHIESYLDAWRQASMEIEEIAPIANSVVARIRWVGTGRTTGIEVETPPFGAVYDFRVGRVIRVRQFATHAEALEAVGLSE